ncbi:hypothetical protein FSP39_001658 [Pinctada imbricata]|uniref:Fucolectin tachylectin-4 pentraxin-1 domain-containing protein n=1 Tax=Pinctada imbricata TaxID=66713 RepID=A0AA88YLF4_PINIB|nr:hypothetical protein FSP39_001658 [Pinctada imbricata]
MFETYYHTHLGNMSNLAYKKLTLQSSTFQNKRGRILSSDKAVDGINITNNEVHSCASTMEEARPYWYVDLGQEYCLKYVEIANRGDCCAQRLHDVEVTVAGHYKDFKKLCGFFKGPGTAGQIVVLNCPLKTKGRYVKIQIVDGIENFLTLCEVRVIGK